MRSTRHISFPTRPPSLLPDEDCFAHEEAVLGGLMWDPETTVHVLPLLSPRCFATAVHQHIFSAIACLHARGSDIDTVTVAEELERREQLYACGGIDYLAQLVMETASTANILLFVVRLQDCARRRQIRALARAALNVEQFDQSVDELAQILITTRPPAGSSLLAMAR